MEYLLVAFRSRAETLKFGELLRKNGARFEIVNTPKEAKTGCGLSVKTDTRNLRGIKRLLSLNGYRTLVAVFLVKEYSGGKTLRYV